MSLQMLSQGRPHHLGAMIVSGITGWNPYVSYLRKRSTNGTVVLKHIHGHSMEIDLSDNGLSRNLLMFHTWEDRAARAYRRELSELAERTDDPVVLEIGANIGYYCLQEAQILGPDATIHAFEPEPRNFELLRRNVKRNGYQDRTVLRNVAVTPTGGAIHFEISSEGNQHRVVTEQDENTVEVESVGIGEYLHEQEIAPEAVSAIRMDIQGLEAELLRELEDVLSTANPLVLFIGLHSSVDESDLKWLLTQFAERFDIASVTTGDGVQQWQTVPVNVNSFDELFDSPYDSVELVLKKGL